MASRTVNPAGERCTAPGQQELLARNPAALTRVRGPRKHRSEPWTVDEARRFLESAKEADDPFYAAYVLVLLLGLRRGEALGLTWNDFRAAAAELHINWQLTRVSHNLLHSDTKLKAPPQCCRSRRSA